MKTMLINYKDIQVCDSLEFGFPIGFKGCTKTLTSKDQIWKYKNQKGQTEFPNDINAYGISKEKVSFYQW